MNFRNLAAAMMMTAVVFASCKNDKEGDIPKPQDGNYTGIVLNEICGKQDPDDDWVEIFNGSAADVNIGGVQLVKTDETGAVETIYTVPAGTVIAAGAYKVIATVSGELQAGISNSKQVGIALESPSGNTVIDSFDRDSDVGLDNGHQVGGSYARIPNGTGDWAVVSACTRGAANSDGGGSDNPGPDVPDNYYDNLVLNELNGNDTKFIELYNKGQETLDISGVKMLKNDEPDYIYVAPEGTTIAAGGYLVLLADAPSFETGFNCGLSAKKSVKIELVKPDGTTRIDVFMNLKSDNSQEWDETPLFNLSSTGQSFGRTPDGSGEWYTMTPSQGTANTAGDVRVTW